MKKFLTLTYLIVGIIIFFAVLSSANKAPFTPSKSSQVNSPTQTNNPLDSVPTPSQEELVRRTEVEQYNFSIELPPGYEKNASGPVTDSNYETAGQMWGYVSQDNEITIGVSIYHPSYQELPKWSGTVTLNGTEWFTDHRQEDPQCEENKKSCTDACGPCSSQLFFMRKINGHPVFISFTFDNAVDNDLAEKVLGSFSFNN